MNESVIKSTTLLLAVPLLALLPAACATRSSSPPVDATRTRTEDAPAPVVLTIPAERRVNVDARWNALLREQNTPAQNTPAPILAPVTLTLAGLPVLPAPLRLPAVGDAAASAERRAADERESLSRFLEQNATLTGAAPATLSLVRIDELANGYRRAIYEQRPFIYPLRGGFGQVRIDYDATRRIANLTSTALPAAETADAALRTLQARLTASEAQARLADPSARVTELVILPAPRAATNSGAQSVELRLAWEFRVGAGAANATTPFAYVDALNGEIIRLVE